MTNIECPPPGHAREGGHPEAAGLSSGTCIPAQAKMTESGYQVGGARKTSLFRVVKICWFIFSQLWYLPKTKKAVGFYMPTA
jgi:hypothetical protein